MADMRLIVAGAGGRMGRTLVKAIAETKGLVLSGALEGPGSPLLGSSPCRGIKPLSMTHTKRPVALCATASPSFASRRRRWTQSSSRCGTQVSASQISCPERSRSNRTPPVQ